MLSVAPAVLPPVLPDFARQLRVLRVQCVEGPLEPVHPLGPAGDLALRQVPGLRECELESGDLQFLLQVLRTLERDCLILRELERLALLRQLERLLLGRCGLRLGQRGPDGRRK
jgi:hypothetical protein